MNTNKHNNSDLIAQPVKNFKRKFKEWENMLVGKDKHSIRNQIWDMIWDCVFFQCINESRRYIAQDDEGEPKLNKMIHYFIDQSFFKTQLLSLRRLTDKRSDVYSLYSLIEDIKKNNALLTRRNILDAYGLPYDYEKVRAEFDKKIDWTQGAVFEPNEIGHSENIHRQIDSMTGMTADKRTPDDLIPDNILTQLGDKLESVKELCDYVNKYIAHSATPDSRRTIPDEIKGALGKVLNAHKIICETASSIGNKILFCGFGSFLSGPQYGQYDQFDVFEYLDEPIASRETIEKLREFWEKYRTETEQWCK